MLAPTRYPSFQSCTYSLPVPLQYRQLSLYLPCLEPPHSGHTLPVSFLTRGYGAINLRNALRVPIHFSVPPNPIVSCCMSPLNAENISPSKPQFSATSLVRCEHCNRFATAPIMSSCIAITTPHCSLCQRSLYQQGTFSRVRTFCRFCLSVFTNHPFFFVRCEGYHKNHKTQNPPTRRVLCFA